MVFTISNLEPCLPSLRPAFFVTSSQEWFILSCTACTSVYVGQIVRHLTTRTEEHKKVDSLLVLQLQQCSLEGNSPDLSSEIIDMSNNQTKLLKLEAIHIREGKPSLNMRVEFRSRELTLKN